MSWQPGKLSSSPLHLTEAHLEPNQTWQMDVLRKIVNSFQPLTISTKSSILDVQLGSDGPCSNLCFDFAITLFRTLEGLGTQNESFYALIKIRHLKVDEVEFVLMSHILDQILKVICETYVPQIEYGIENVFKK